MAGKKKVTVTEEAATEEAAAEEAATEEAATEEAAAEGAATEEAAAEGAATEEAALTSFRVKSNVNVRVAPDPASDRVGVLTRKTRVKGSPAEGADGRTWVEIKAGPANGFCPRQYLEEV